MSITSELQKLLNSYKTKLDKIQKYKLENKLENKYTNNEYNKLDKMHKKILIYNYNCGVINHTLGNLIEAIEYYEESAYLNFKPAQKAMSYCYKHGILYEQSDEFAELWYKAYETNT